MGVTLLIATTMTLDQKLLADETLVAATLGGERSAFAELVRRYDRPARAICTAILRDQHLACDAAQDAFVEAYRGLKGLKDHKTFGAWILTIARNRALRMRKMRRPGAGIGGCESEAFRRTERGIAASGSGVAGAGAGGGHAAIF